MIHRFLKTEAWAWTQHWILISGSLGDIFPHWGTNPLDTEKETFE